MSHIWGHPVVCECGFRYRSNIQDQRGCPFMAPCGVAVDELRALKAQVSLKPDYPRMKLLLDLIDKGPVCMGNEVR